MKKLALLLALFSSLAAAHDGPAPAPSGLPAPLPAQLQSLQKAALASPWGLQLLQQLSDEIGPRLSGSRGLEAGIELVAERARSAGLATKLEPVMVPHWVRGIETAELVDWPQRKAGLTQKIALTALGNSAATPAAGLTAEVVLAADPAALEALGRKGVEGRIVLFTAAYDEQMAAQGHGGDAYGQVASIRSKGPSKAAALGAVACLVRSAGGGAYRLPHTGNTVFEPGQKAIPAAAVAVEDAELIERLGKVRMQLRLTPQTLPDAQSANVVAELRGSELPEEVVLVSGHLDSWDLGTGALDDGVGVAAALDALRLIAASDLKPRRTLRFVAYTNEENGLMGGKAYALAHAAELGQHVAVLESDSGEGHATGFYARVTPESVALLKPLADAMAPIGAGILEAVSRCPGADIGPLCAAGAPGFAPRQDSRSYFTYHHTAADTFDKINPENLAQNTALLASLLWGLGNLPALPRLPVQTP